jgi:aryl-alcohol dehydrogenase
MRTTAAVLRRAGGPLMMEELDVAPLLSREVLVRIVAAGICHTDLGMIAGLAPNDPPIVLGHEGGGVVEAVGQSVSQLIPGDHVVLSYHSCGTCDNCVSRHPMHCRRFVELNLTGVRADRTTPLSGGGESVRGAFFGQSSWASYAVANEQNCVQVPRDLPLELLGPLGCGMQSGAGAVLNTLRPVPGSSIVVFGTGSVGLAALLAAVVAGCETIIAVDISDSRLQKAVKLGATHTIDGATGDVAARVREITHGMGAEYSVDCVGAPSVVRDALQCLQSPGVCASVGFQGMRNDVTIDQGHLLFGRSLVGVVEGDAIPAEFVPRLIGLYQAGRFPFDQLIDLFPFERINEALDAVRRGDVTKAVLVMNNETAIPATGHVDG